MKKLAFMFCLISCISCKEKIIDLSGYYYNASSLDIFNIDNSVMTTFNMIDSTSFKTDFVCYMDKIKVDDSVFNYTKNNDSLTIFNYPADGQNFNLIKFEYEPVKLNEITTKQWKMTIDKYSKDKSTKYSEDQFIIIDKNKVLNAYFKNQNDTIFGAEYEFKGLFFNRFNLFNRGFTNIIIYSHLNQEIKILIYDGYNSTKSYILNEL